MIMQRYYCRNTVLLPVLPLSVWFNLSMIPMIWVLLIYAVWSLVALLLMGSMAQEQRADVDQRILEKIDEVSGQVSSLEHKHDESAATIAGLQQQVDEVDQVMRNAFEELGADLPGRRYYVQASVSSLSIMTGEARRPFGLRLWSPVSAGQDCGAAAPDIRVSPGSAGGRPGRWPRSQTGCAGPHRSVLAAA